MYRWNYKAWQSELVYPNVEKDFDARAVIERKTNAFWEVLAQNLAERIMGMGNSPQVFKFGPRCVKESACKSADGVMSGVEKILVRTRIDGARDPRDPVSRTIVMVVNKSDFSNAKIGLSIDIPIKMNVASTYMQNLDLRPVIGGSPWSGETLSVQAFATEKARDQGTHYPDFNLIYAPMRHLVFEGIVSNTKQSNASENIKYSSESEFKEKFTDIVNQMKSRETVGPVVEKINSFLNSKYYYMLGQSDDELASYGKYLLGESSGIGAGLQNYFSKIVLVGDGKVLAEVSY